MKNRYYIKNKTIDMKRTKLFFDTEFTGLHKNTTLISIGIVSECGKSFYAELNDYDSTSTIGWTNKEETINNLIMTASPEGQMEYYTCSRSKDNSLGNDIYNGCSIQLRCNKAKLKEELTKWLLQFEQVEMWSDCLAYDWVLFNDIFGTAFDIPSNVYYIPLDISTFLHLRGYDPDVSREEFADGYIDTNNKGINPEIVVKHNALWDAYVIKGCYNRLCNEKPKK